MQTESARPTVSLNHPVRHTEDSAHVRKNETHAHTHLLYTQ